MTIDAFIKSLASYEGALTFNPWKDTDLRYEVENAPSIRKEQLHDYLSRRVGKAKLFLIAEACGYQGGHFTGIAMTCERMILNEHPAVNSLMILGKEGKRTSRKDSPMIAKPTQKEKGFNEPTDSVVWKACLDAGLSADEFILWNIYPFHPHKKDDLLSNRTPTDDELAIGVRVSGDFCFGVFDLFAIDADGAVGDVFSGLAFGFFYAGFDEGFDDVDRSFCDFAAFCISEGAFDFIAGEFLSLIHI